MNLPNKLSLGRIVMVPIIVVFSLFVNLGEAFSITMNGNVVSMQWEELIVVVLFAIASITDMLDGMIARKYNMITSFGKFIDPIADKALTTTMFILFAIDGIIPPLVVFFTYSFTFFLKFNQFGMIGMVFLYTIFIINIV